MKFLVLGASGMAGHMIGLYLQEKGHEVVGFSRHGVNLFPCVEGDAFDRSTLASLIRNDNFDVVVNSIGILNEDAERHKEKAAYLNAYLPHELAAITEGYSTRIFHLSTDCVFAGNAGPYSETSLPDGISFYDRSKALGELDDSKNLTLRQSIVGPDINTNGIGLLNWFMKQNGTVHGFQNVLWTGLTTLELAHAIEAAALQESTGLVNMVPDTNISKHDLLCLFNKHMRAEEVALEPVKEPYLDKTLVRTVHNVDFRPQSYSQQVKDLAGWMCDHAEIYRYESFRQVRS